MNFLMKQMIKSQMKGVPEEQVDLILNMMDKNPELFKKIAAEIKTAVDSGKDQMAATQEVMKKYEDDLKSLSN